MIRCPGCGGQNPREALSCEWCRRPFVKTRTRGLSARWWGVLSAAIVGVLVLLVAILAVLNASRPTARSASAAPTPSPPSVLPVSAASPGVAAISPQTPAASSAVPEAIPATPALAPTAVPTPPPPSRYARVSNTAGVGVNLRSEPTTSAPTNGVVAEGTVVRLVGPDQRGPDNRVWRQVEDPRGTPGWVPAEFLVETQSPNG